MEEKNKKELIELVKSLQKEKQDLEKAYIELDLECRDLRTENEELKSPKFASWKLKFFRLKEEFDKELAEHEEFAKKANAEIERLTSLYDGKGGFMTSGIGDLPLTVDGLRRAVDEISRLLIVQGELQELNANYYNEAKDLRRENAELQKQVDELKQRLHMIWALGFDYDGCNKTESLKGLIDELVKITQMDSKEFAEYYNGVEVE